MERIEPIQFTFDLYFPKDLKYPALKYISDEVAAIKQSAPRSADQADSSAARN